MDLSAYQLAQSRKLEEKQRLEQAQEHVEHVRAAQALVQRVAQELQQQAHQQIAALVTYCLEAVFGRDAYQFKIDFRRERGKTSAHMLLVRGGEEFDPLDATGGGVVDVVSFGLRLAALLLTRPKKRLLLVLDEPFKHVSKEYHPQIRQLLVSLSHKLGVQIIFVTHNRDLQIGKVVEL